MGKGVYRVPGKAADGFCDDHINFPCLAIRNQPLKILPRVLSSGFRLVRVNAAVYPIPVVLNQVTVIADLR